MAKVLRNIELLATIQIPGGPGRAPTVDSRVTHRGVEGFELSIEQDGGVIITHPGSKIVKRIPAHAVLSYEWLDESPALKAAK